MILIVAINARYSHCSFSALTLRANLGPYRDDSAILEADLTVLPVQLAADILARKPTLVAFSAYLWNIRTVEQTARILRLTAPDLPLTVGGPEITPDYPHADLFNGVICGEGETVLREWAGSLTAADHLFRITEPEDPARLELPYPLYTDHDLAHRVVYVETSRGCPYGCTYCTSAHTGLRLFPPETLLPALDTLWRRGLRQFKFLDRSFNAPREHARQILAFFMERMTPDLRLHFEINTDHLDPGFAQTLTAFPNGVLHLECGIQTLNPATAAAIGRSPDTDRTLENLRFLTEETGATVHADLIFGLPCEDEASFSAGFNRLLSTCHPAELQVNWLKGLPGTAMVRDAAKWGLIFNPAPPYELLSNDLLDFAALTRLQHFARCWELVHNRGRFPHALARFHALCADNLFAAYQALTRRVLAAEGRLFALSLPRLKRLLCEELLARGLSETETDRLFAQDGI